MIHTKWSDISDDEFQVLEELEATGMDMKAKFDDGKDALIYFEDMAAMLEINKNQAKRYDQICQKLSAGGEK